MDAKNDEDIRSRLVALYRSGRYGEAERLSLHLLRMRPGDIALLHLLGDCANRAGRFQTALALADRFDSPPDAEAEAWALRGDSYGKLKLLERALDSYDHAIERRPDYAQAYSRRGLILLKQRDYRAALASCTRATTIDPGLAEAWSALARVFGKLKHHDLAAGAYRRALAIEPRMPFVKGRLLQHMLSACDWRMVGTLIEEIEQEVLAGTEAARPFVWQAVCSSPRSLQLCAATFTRTLRHSPQERATCVTGARSTRLRIGYVSGELRDHSASYLRAGVFEHHDRSSFEIVGFDNGWDDGGATRARINASMDRIISIATTTDAEAASIIRDQAIDILVDMNGFYGLHRMGVFALHPAPIQVTFPGYPGTLGAPFIDYIVADEIVLPRDHQRFFSESPVYLPHSYQPNDSRKPISARKFTRQELGLPAEGFIFCCFNNNHKILPAMFDAWARILHAVPGSVLWLLGDNPIAGNNLRKEAVARGLDPTRLVLADRMPAPDHLARQRCADLFLDTLPYNAHTTASDALWAGLPVLTCLGEAFAGRVAASLLHAIDLPELVTQSIAEYEREAVSLAGNPERLALLRTRLTRNRLSAPLFDTPLFTRKLEAAYLAMYDRHQAGLAPEPITVA